MNIKKSLSTLIILTMLCTGCSTYQVKNRSVSLPNEATKQKTMTKVQNDINEIIDKEYEYVMSNLGEPNATAYWIDKSKINDIENVEDVEKLTDVNLVYLKDVSNEVTNSSALYLQLENDKVKKVQIVDYSSPSLSNSLIKSKILINCYTNGDIVKLDNLNKKNLDEFIGIDSNDMEKIVGDKKVSYDAYLLDNKYINVYKLDEGNKLLAIFVKNNKISQIKVLSNKDEVLSTIKNITLNK